MARVEWSRLSGEDVESAIAIALCRRFPHAVRVRPSIGDQGIDILVPNGDGFDVYQVKKFAENLKSSQKTQCIKSLKRILKYSTEKNFKLKAWHLTMPVNPTNENLTWFNTFTKETTVACDWKGLDFTDGLAAEFPDVIDYYLRDGKDRLQRALQELSSATGLFVTSAISSDTSHPMTPADAISGLRSVYETLNRIDPQFRYEFLVSESAPELRDQAGLVFSATEGGNGSYVTIFVFARYREATSDRPVNITISVPADSDAREALERMFLTGGSLSKVQTSQSPPTFLAA